MNDRAWFRGMVACALAAALGWGCPGGDDDDDDDITLAPIDVVTYNAGLAVGFVPGAEDRATKLPDTIAGLGADVVCLQEVWMPAHVDALLAASGEAYPHAFVPAAQQTVVDVPACDAGDIGPLVECVQTSCVADCVDDLVDCMFASCVWDFLGLETACMECVQANVGRDPADIEATCTTEHTKYAYDGSFGTVLLSAHPLSGAEEHVFDSTTNRRSVLHAVADTPGGAVDVYCTHLTAVFATIPYPRDDGSWAAEQLVQVEALVDFIETTRSGDRVVLLGDMNTGPAVGESVAVERDSWDVLDAAGMDAPYVEAGGPCTMCPDNPLRDELSDPEVIDHVLVDGFGEATAATRILDEEITSERCGEAIPAALSDHYGVRVTLPPR